MVPLHVTQFRRETSTTTSIGDDSDDQDELGHRAAKKRKVQIGLESSILAKLSRHERTEENLIPWLQIVERILDKYPKVFASE